MIRKLTLLLIFSVVCLSSAFSQDIFSLKGKNIVITNGKIGFKWHYIGAAGDVGTYEYNENFGKIYKSSALEKNKFSKKHLYKGDIIGQPVYVSDIYYINSDKKKKKAIVLLLKTDSCDLAMHLPLYIKTDIYHLGQRIDYRIEPDEIDLNYYDMDKVKKLEAQMKNKRYFIRHKNDINNYISTFEGFTMKEGSLKINFNSSNTTIRPNSTEKRTKYEAVYKTLDEYFNNVVMEDDLILECKHKHDSLFINDFKEEFLNKEIFFSGTKNDFYICSNVDIKNTGSNSPFYDYVVTLHNSNETIDLPLQKDTRSYITLAEEYREELRIKEEERRKKESEYQARLANEEEEYKASLIKKFGRKNALLILDNIVQIGFTKQMCIESWGQPYDINRTITSGGIHEQWVYGIGRYLYFEGNILTAIQD